MARRVFTVDGWRKWRVGTRETDVRLDGRCDGGLGQQRNNCGGWASMRERVESPGTYVTERVSRVHFWLALCSFWPPSRARWLSPGEGWDAVTWNCWDKLKIKTQMASIWAKGCMFMIVCVCYLTWYPLCVHRTTKLDYLVSEIWTVNILTFSAWGVTVIF